jgi:glycosyltransferase involved in cell wall biosynthesis
MTANTAVRLVVVGHLTLDSRFEAVRDRIVTLPWTDDIQAYWSLLAEADVNLAVLARYPTTDAKSEIKWLEAAVMGIPSLVSDTDRYREVLTDEVDALVAADAQEWSEKLRRLVADPALRTRIGNAARAKAAREYGLQRNAERLADCLSPAWARPSPGSPGHAKPRVLLVNIFFPPQTIGGSTRVVRDNLDAWLGGAGAGRFDFAVAASEDRNPVPHQLRVEPYGGVPVFRISTPEGETMDWAWDFPGVGERFAQALRAWKPDLVHFHALSRLSASVVEACRAAGVPYVVTVHDAWWISDWHFLVDAAGQVREPCEPLPLAPPPGVSVGESLQRRRRLRSLLQDASAVLGVSETFAGVYRSCGFDVRAVPNGVPPMPSAPRRPSESGRVRLCHVGSQTRHKGYHLVEAALKQGAYANLELTVIEHGRFGGEVHHAVWGATPVRFVGKTRGEAMADFYAGQDVLLAPSVWPESYGLVAREALACGLRVVAGDRGAMGEDVRPGVNGWVVDVTAAAALQAVLRELDAEPERFLTSPPPTLLRPASAQAEELLGVYDAVLGRDRPDSRELTRAPAPLIA